LRMVAAIRVYPACRRSPIARLRRVVMMRGRESVRTREAPSRKVTSRTQPIERDTTTFEELVGVLRVWARGLLGLEAAVELLVRHRFWLRRRDFLAVAVPVDWDGVTGSGSAWVDFEVAVAALRAGQVPCSSSQAQLLRIAASLATDEPVVPGQAVSGLDEPNAVAVAAAVLHAAGHLTRPVLAGDARGAWGR
jgi:hypothetical protein